MPHLRTPDATIFYRLQGSGPVLVLSQSGEGDADRTTDLVPFLAAHHTVLTYDRRGLSRSRSRVPSHPASMADHAEDLRYLIHHVADSPVRMLGCSLGAVIGLHAGTQEPRLLEVLVAHEPVAPWLLPPSAAEEHRRELREIARTYRESGLDVTLPMIVESLGIDPATGRCESDLTPFPMDDRRLRNFDHFLRRDLEASAEDVMDPADLLDVPTRVIPAAGDLTPEGVFDRRCAEALSVLTSTPLEIFPGGHNGNLTHPNRYAARLRQVLAD